MIDQNEAYRKLEIDVIDEDERPDAASAYQYRLVPNFWVDDEKVLEGIPNRGKIKDVLEKALDQKV